MKKTVWLTVINRLVRSNDKTGPKQMHEKVF